MWTIALGLSCVPVTADDYFALLTLMFLESSPLHSSTKNARHFIQFLSTPELSVVYMH